MSSLDISIFSAISSMVGSWDNCFVGSVAQGAADADGIVVAQVASYFTYNHGNEGSLSKQKGLVCENRLVYNGRKRKILGR